MMYRSFFFLLFITILSCSINKSWITLDIQPKEHLHDIEVISDNLAFSYSYGSGNLYKTENGGKLWSRIYQFDSIYFEQIQFLDAQTGWIVGSRHEIYKTEDGGVNWDQYKMAGESENSLIYGMYFESKAVGYIAPFDNKGTRIYKTNDGGKNWKLINTVNGGIMNVEMLNGSLYGTGFDLIVKDLHLENSWAEVFRDTSKKTGQLRDIAIGADGKLIASSFNGSILVFENGLWNKHRITKNRLRNIISTSNNSWYTSGDANEEKGNFFISKNNGKDWEIVAGEFQDIHRIFSDEKNIWIVGKEGMIRKLKR